jgi:hypothetical protein
MTTQEGDPLFEVSTRLNCLAHLLTALAVGAEMFGPKIDVGSIYAALRDQVKAIEATVDAINT